MLEELEHECRKNDANVSIRNGDEIVELFKDAITSFLNALEENLRFRNDLEITINYSETEDNVELFTVNSKIDDVCLSFSYEMQINDSEGADSSLYISCDNEEFCTYVGYCNRAVEYDEESGLYMPITEDEIDDVDNAVDEILDLIRIELPIGTCMSCGYVNAVYECEMCHSWFNNDEDRRVIDDIAFCQNCLDRMEEE